MANIQVSATSDGSTPYTFVLNPYAWDAAGGSDKVRVRILHGNAAYQERYWDSRERKLVWSGVYASASYDSTGFTDQYDTMANWVGEYKYFYFASMDDMNDNWPVSNQWKKARVVDIIPTYAPADRSGIPMYERVELVIAPEQ